MQKLCVYIYKIIIFFLLFTDFKIVSTFFFLILVIKFKRRRIIPKREINTVSASVILQKVYHWITSSSSSPLPGFSHENRDISVSLGNFINRRHLFFFLFFFVEQRREIFFILVRAIEDRSSRERKKKNLLDKQRWTATNYLYYGNLAVRCSWIGRCLDQLCCAPLAGNNKWRLNKVRWAVGQDPDIFVTGSSKTSRLFFQ